jgi:NAD+ kinase
MHAMAPVRAMNPPRRVSLVLHPRRDVTKAVEYVEQWALTEGVLLAGVDDLRMPRSARRCRTDELAQDCDMLLALGGDGTMLGALRVAAPAGVPVLGVNLGRLGYLTEVEAEKLPKALNDVANGDFAIEERSALSATWEEEDGGTCDRVAYNDVVLSRVPGQGQAALALLVDGHLLVRYASDGVIAATPAGSTAYSFAAGGPIVSPQTRAMIVTPDAPHGLFNRAVVLGDGESLGVEVLPTSSQIAVEVDGRLVAEVAPGWKMQVAPAAQPALVVVLGESGFAERARRKLGIVDPAGLADYDLAGHER